MGEIVEPTSLYTKSKRNVLLISAVLFLIVLGQVRLTEKASSLPVSIDNPEYVPHILFAVEAFLIYQLWFSWELQRSVSSRLLTVDFIVTCIISAASLFTYAQHYLPLLTANIPFSLVSILIGAAGFAALLYASAELVKRRGIIDRLRTTFLRERLFEAGWIMNFNQQAPNGKKEISFNQDGTVGAGRNANEDRWEWIGRNLKLIRADGSLQNIFVYDPRNDQFTSVPDSSAKGLPDQIIYRKTA